MICIQFLKLEGCELTDRDIFNVPEINCKVKYLCLRDNKFTKPWQLLAIRFPLVEHLDMKRNKIPVERIGKSYEGNKLEHCTRIDVDEWDYRSEKFFRAYCPSLKYVNGVKLEQVMGTQGAAATSGADDEGYWTRLGNNDAQREKALKHRKDCRDRWYPLFRESLGRALAEVRQWEMRDGKLIPRSFCDKDDTNATRNVTCIGVRYVSTSLDFNRTLLSCNALCLSFGPYTYSSNSFLKHETRVPDFVAPGLASQLYFTVFVETDIVTTKNGAAATVNDTNHQQGTHRGVHHAITAIHVGTAQAVVSQDQHHLVETDSTGYIVAVETITSVRALHRAFRFVLP
ncbi:unnamed protein product [Heligmosomoides polygyrus]|uniref:Leucine-rich repeat protein n=1 Tax=Heligmosomoides polygyrus TaxID=6339 RepID=A0A183GTG8_HELPZ|nr:unnamed protein product [Heligmosomoides polygyrus]